MDTVSVLHLITELNIGGAQGALACLNRRRFDFGVVCLYNDDKAVARQVRATGISVTDLGMTAKWRLDLLWWLYYLWSWASADARLRGSVASHLDYYQVPSNFLRSLNYVADQVDSWDR